MEKFTKKTVEQLEVEGKRVLVRVDFNVPLKNGEVADDTRLLAAMPTIRYLVYQRACVILCSHLGRPGGKVVEELRLDPVASRLAELLERRVEKTADCVGPKVEETAKVLSRGDLLLLENTRFHPGEKANDPEFAAQLAALAEVYVDDAFATAHRAHASTEGVTHFLPSAAGKLMANEIKTLSRTRDNPRQPLMMLFGGAKISDKIGVIENLMDRADKLLIGGAMANTFFKARGLEVGASLVEEDSLETASRILSAAGDKLLLPIDVVIAREATPAAERLIIPSDQMPADWRILDIGPKSVELYKEKMQQAGTVIWNGPMGVFEIEPFARGTRDLALALAELPADTISGGGETAAAIHQAGLSDQFTHVSTGGGAFLTFLSGRELPAVAALDDAP